MRSVLMTIGIVVLYPLVAIVLGSFLAQWSQPRHRGPGVPWDDDLRVVDIETDRRRRRLRREQTAIRLSKRFGKWVS